MRSAVGRCTVVVCTGTERSTVHAAKRKKSGLYRGAETGANGCTQQVGSHIPKRGLIPRLEKTYVQPKR